MKRELALKYISLFCIGAFLYVTIETCFRGYSYYAMMLLSGALFIAIDSINDEYFSWDLDLILQSLIGAGLITFSELIIGEVIKCAGAPQMWDYSNLPFNFDGVICLPFFFIWIFLSAIAIILTDSINYYLLQIGEVPHYKILNKIITFPE